MITGGRVGPGKYDLEGREGAIPSGCRRRRDGKKGNPSAMLGNYLFLVPPLPSVVGAHESPRGHIHK